MSLLEKVRQRVESDAENNGYYLNYDPQTLSSLIEGLAANEESYGYPSCPCRISTGDFDIDRDIICPCDYRDPDVMDYGMCYCGLFMDKETHEREEIEPIRERRPTEKQLKVLGALSQNSVEGLVTTSEEKVTETDRSLLYCKQCGYVVFRDEPPYVCPICRANKEMFAKIKSNVEFFTT